MAVDRYLCALHPEKYHQHSSKKVCAVQSNDPCNNYYRIQSKELTDSRLLEGCVSSTRSRRRMKSAFPNFQWIFDS